MKMVSDACLLVEVDSDSISEFSCMIQRKLSEMGIESVAVPGAHHVSIGYMAGDVDAAILELAAKHIAGKCLSFEISGIEALPGITSGRDYITLRVIGNSDMEESIGMLSSLPCARKFADGFKTHLSLLTIDQGVLGAVELETLARVLELQVLGLIPNLMATIRSVSIFSRCSADVVRLPVGPTR
jgi:hypothetical protein